MTGIMPVNGQPKILKITVTTSTPMSRLSVRTRTRPSAILVNTAPEPAA
jgi:hypothetical protein